MEGLNHMLSIEDVASKVFGVRKTKAWELMAAPEAPKPVKLGTRTTRWFANEVLHYAANLPRQRVAEPPELKEARGRVYKSAELVKGAAPAVAA